MGYRFIYELAFADRFAVWFHWVTSTVLLDVNNTLNSLYSLKTKQLFSDHLFRFLMSVSRIDIVD